MMKEKLAGSLAFIFGIAVVRRFFLMSDVSFSSIMQKPNALNRLPAVFSQSTKAGVSKL
ncbi:MAG: hypothetical protein ICV68_07270 [Pyrinomonadaceae bacterium]|nr:hypothetical protein [Pyrinomonadaceae bacterium]